MRREVSGNLSARTPATSLRALVASVFLACSQTVSYGIRRGLLDLADRFPPLLPPSTVRLYILIAFTTSSRDFPSKRVDIARMPSLTVYFVQKLLHE